MREETITVQHSCDRCGHVDKTTEGRDVRDDEAGHLDVSWCGNKSYRDDYNRWVDNEERGAAWLCQMCRKDFLKFMSNRESVVVTPSSTCTCAGWGCWGCCTTEAEIRAKQGTPG